MQDFGGVLGWKEDGHSRSSAYRYPSGDRGTIGKTFEMVFNLTI